MTKKPSRAQVCPAYAEDAAGYPNMAFEAFYQFGIECFMWGFSRPLVRQAFKQACLSWGSSSWGAGRAVQMWQVRAFLLGLRGYRAGKIETRLSPAGYAWPSPPDPSWSLVVCLYPDGAAELDFLHEVSRRFWSEDHDDFDLPCDDFRLDPAWFKRMGFDIIYMQPAMRVAEGPRTSHLKMVK